MIPGSLSRDSLPRVGGRPLASICLHCFQVKSPVSQTFQEHVRSIKLSMLPPTEPGKGLLCPRKLEKHQRNKRAAVVSRGPDSRSWKCVFSFPRVPRLMCPTAAIYFQSRLRSLTVRLACFAAETLCRLVDDKASESLPGSSSKGPASASETDRQVSALGRPPAQTRTPAWGPTQAAPSSRRRWGGPLLGAEFWWTCPA